MTKQCLPIHLKFSLLILASLAGVSGCSDSDKKQTAIPEGEYLAVVASVASDYTSSELAIIESKAPYEVLEGYSASADSDIAVATYGDYYYRIGKKDIDNITRYQFETPTLADWQFTTKDSPSDVSSNPYSMHFVNDQKAYLIRYDAPQIWIVNPSVAANDEDGFKLGEIDLSAYDTDASPNAAAAVLHDGRLFVVMQALQPDNSFGPAYLAVIDTATDLEIDLDGNPANGLGMALTVKNPWEIDVQGNNIFVTGLGHAWAQVNPYDGGIEKISTVDYSSTLVRKDDSANGNTLRSAYISNTQGYLVAQAAYKSTSLYQFNPATGDVVSLPVDGFSGVDIRSLEVSPEGLLWVGLGSSDAPEIKIIDPADNSLVETISISMNPAQIAFSSNRATP